MNDKQIVSKFVESLQKYKGGGGILKLLDSRLSLDFPILVDLFV